MKYLKYIIISFLFIFSFIYTNKIINIIKNKDPIMNNIKLKEKEERIDSINATIKDNTIIPGINGCTIDINKSYKNMKRINKYNEKLLKYKDIIPEITLTNIYNKYIVKGNKSKRNVSIIIKINNDVNIINKYKDIKLNVFLDSKFLIDGKVELNNNLKIYNGGTNYIYDDITIEWMNDVINSNYNESLYCLNNDKNDDNLLICARNKMHSITPNVVINSNIYLAKKEIDNGDIIYIEEKNINELNNLIKYLNSKGYEIVHLDELLSENVC